MLTAASRAPLRRIVCVGNRFAPGDDAGPRVFDRLEGERLDDDVQVIDGGLAGLDLLRFVDGATRVVFVDSVRGVAEPGGTMVLSREQAASFAGARWDHAAGLAYLLRVLPDVCEGAVPEVFVVGIEEPAYEDAIERAVALCKRAIDGGVTIPWAGEQRGTA